jgi:hypothetical protein
VIEKVEGNARTAAGAATGTPWSHPSCAQNGRSGAAQPVANAHSCRYERVPSAHPYAEVSIFIRDQQCSDKYVAEYSHPPLGACLIGRISTALTMGHVHTQIK